MSRTRAKPTAVVSLALGAALAFSVTASAADKAQPILRLRAFALDMNRGSRSTTLDVVIERWSTAQEIKSFQDASVEGGDGALLKALQKTKPRCGYVRPETGLPWDVYLATETPLPGGGRTIVVASDRPVSLSEASNPSTLEDYKVSLVEIRLGADGKGEGNAIPYAELSYDPDTKTFDVENYQEQPVRLSPVAVVKP